MTADPVVVAVDVGGTAMKSALVDRRGRLTESETTPTPTADGPDAVLAGIRSTVLRLAGSARPVAAVGVVVPGAVDAGTGIARYSANLGWRDVPLRDLIAGDTGLPTAIDHDIRAGGLAERLLGGSGRVDDSLIVIIGTGVAGLITSGGHQIRGATGVAGEIGHLPVYPDGERCPCGQRGCLERYASAAAISRHYHERTGQTVSSQQIVDRLPADPEARRVWQEATTALGVALASCTMTLDPALILLAGGLSAAGEALVEPVRRELTTRVTWREIPVLAVSPLGRHAGLLGAAVVAWRLAGQTDFAQWPQQAPA